MIQIICPYCKETDQVSTCETHPTSRNCILSSNTYYDEKGLRHNHGHQIFEKRGTCSNRHEFIHLNVTRPSCKPCGIRMEKRGYHESAKDPWHYKISSPYKPRMIQEFIIYHKYTDGNRMFINSKGCCEFESDQEEDSS